MNYLLAAAVESNQTLAAKDALSYGGGVVLLGMATVFAVLTIIWITLIIFKFFFHDLKLNTKIKAESHVEKTPDPAPAPASASSDEEIVAVIAAAIAAAESESANGTKFRVVSFNRK